jgi:hypothetical protein
MTAKEFAMSHADIEPSLRSGEKALESLDDGFSPPATDTAPGGGTAPEPSEAEPVLSTKSPF